jgi:hypothetical protein
LAGSSVGMPLQQAPPQMAGPPPSMSQFHPSQLDHSAMVANGFCPHPPPAAWIHPAFAMNSINQAAFAKFSLRKGKWTEEEESYTKKLIDVFSSGYLRIATGTTLRSFLAERLFWYVRVYHS